MVNYYNSKSRLIHALVILLISQTSTPSLGLETKGNVFPAFIRWHVTVVNGLNDAVAISVHCRSQDDDLGLQTLPPTADFSWSFEANFFHSTLFWCRLRKGGSGVGNSVTVAFKVFWHDVRLFERCGWKNCIWIAKDDGIYNRDSAKGIDEFCYSWKG